MGLVTIVIRRTRQSWLHLGARTASAKQSVREFQRSFQILLCRCERLYQRIYLSSDGSVGPNTVCTRSNLLLRTGWSFVMYSSLCPKALIRLSAQGPLMPSDLSAQAGDGTWHSLVCMATDHGVDPSAHEQLRIR